MCPVKTSKKANKIGVLAAQALVVGALLSGTDAARAVPMLQLDIGGGFYDEADESVLTGADSFTLYAYARRTIDLERDYFISIGLTPQADASLEDFGSFSINGTTFTRSNLIFGVPPLDDPAGADRDSGDLQRHGIFPTLFTELTFNFSGATRNCVNVQDDPGTALGSASLCGDGRLYYQGFDFDVSGLLPGFELHFDLYDEVMRENCRRGECNYDLDIDHFAPFSHDAGTTTSVPEPGSLGLLGAGLLGLGMARRRRGR